MLNQFISQGKNALNNMQELHGHNKIATINIIRIRPSPFFTENFADHHAPNAFPAARVRPNFKSTWCVKKK